MNNNESMGGGLSEEEKVKQEEVRRKKAEQDAQDKEDQELLEAYLATVPVIPSLRESGPEIAEFENMIFSLESTYPNAVIAELNSIVSQKEALNNPTRELLRKALNPVVAMLNIIKKETNITPEKIKEITEKYKKFSRAVGMINNGMVDHTR